MVGSSRDEDNAKISKNSVICSSRADNRPSAGLPSGSGPSHRADSPSSISRNNVHVTGRENVSYDTHSNVFRRSRRTCRPSSARYLTSPWTPSSSTSTLEATASRRPSSKSRPNSRAYDTLCRCTPRRLIRSSKRSFKRRRTKVSNFMEIYIHFNYIGLLFA